MRVSSIQVRGAVPQAVRRNPGQDLAAGGPQHCVGPGLRRGRCGDEMTGELGKVTAPTGRASRHNRHLRGGRAICTATRVGLALSVAKVSGVDEELWSAYNAMGTSYEQHAAHSPYNAHYDRPAVLAALGPVTGLRVLDAACGPGFYAQQLLAQGAKVTAFDASAVMVGLARQQTAGRAQIDLAVLGGPLPYPDAVFDLIVCALAIHYASDRAAAFAEFFRVLHPGGALVVSTQHPTADWLRKGGSYFEVKLETDIWRVPSGDQPVRFWREPLSALCAAATGAGFLIEKVIEPLPADSMRELFPEDHDKLSTEPGFLILRMARPDVGTSVT
jgi:SAM-dependent methyltransferase